MQLNSQPLRTRIGETVLASVGRYVDMARGGGTWTTPESWMQHAIALELKSKGFAVAIEVGPNEMAGYAGKRQRKAWARKRVDVAVYDKAKDPHGKYPQRGTTEVKKSLNCHRDAMRMRAIAKAFHPQIDSAQVVVSYQDTKAERLVNKFEALAERLNARAIKIAQPRKMISSGRAYCAAMVAELLPPPLPSPARGGGSSIGAKD